MAGSTIVRAVLGSSDDRKPGPLAKHIEAMVQVLRRAKAKAMDAGIKIAISTDAHAATQLEWQPYGTDRAAECGVTADRVVNSWSADDLLDWCGSHPT